jgi:hypothetical protein
MASQFAKNGYNVLFCNERLISPTNFKKEQIAENLTIYPNFEYAIYEIKKNNINIDIFYTTAAITYKYIDIVKPELTLYHSCDVFEE